MEAHACLASMAKTPWSPAVASPPHHAKRSRRISPHARRPHQAVAPLAPSCPARQTLIRPSCPARQAFLSLAATLDSGGQSPHLGVLSRGPCRVAPSTARLAAGGTRCLHGAAPRPRAASRGPCRHSAARSSSVQPSSSLGPHSAAMVPWCEPASSGPAWRTDSRHSGQARRTGPRPPRVCASRAARSRQLAMTTHLIQFLHMPLPSCAPSAAS
jgi:hypothetical protein